MNPFGIRRTLVAVTGPPGSGKTRYCLDRFAQCPAGVLVVFGKDAYRELAESAVRSRADWCDDLEFNMDSLQDWNRFAAYVLDQCNAPPHPLAGRIPRVAIAAEAVESVSGGLFEKVRSTLGFHERFADLVGELISAGFTPGSFVKGAERSEVSDPRFRGKVEEIANLWSKYERSVEKLRLTLPAKLPSLAADALTTSARLADEIWFDGFQTLSQAQIELLDALTEQCRVGVTIPWQDERRDLLQNSARLLERLGERFDLVRVVTSDEPTKYRGKTLFALSQGLFRDDPPPAEWDEPIQIVNCPTRLAEVEWTARWILRMSEDQALKPSDFVVVAREIEAYWPLVQLVFPRFGLSPSRSVERRVTDSPFVRFVLSSAELIRDDWQREDVIRHISSSYAFDAGEQAAIRVALKGSRARHGLDYWKPKLEQIFSDGCRAAGRLVRLAEWSEEFGGRKSPTDFAALVRELSTEMGWTDRAGNTNSPHRQEDFIAMEAAHRSADALEQIELITGDGKLRFPQFLYRWTRMCRLARYRVPPNPGVRIIENPDEISFVPRIAFLLGLLEGVFPRRLTEDPFLNDEERVELRRVTGNYLQTGEERIKDERERFYKAATLPSERLFLFYPQAGEESESIPTLYLDEVRRCLPPAAVKEETILLAQPEGSTRASQLAPTMDFALTEEDQLLAAAARIPGAPKDYDALLDDWRILPRLPRITLPEAAMVAGPRKGAISVTELESLNNCPFQHWAQYRAGLRDWPLGISRRDQGTVVHAVLRNGLQSAKLEDLERTLLAALEEWLEEMESEAPDWEVELLRAYATKVLLEFCEREIRLRMAYGMVPAHLEWQFGQEAKEGRQRDPASTNKPLEYELSDGKMLQIAGSVDRIDRSSIGTATLLMDYKLGSAKAARLKDIEEGKSLQLPLYALAVEQLLNADAASLAYDGMEGNERLLMPRFANHKEFQIDPRPPHCDVRPLPDSHWERIQATVREKVTELVGRLERADIFPTPDINVCGLCDYGDLCRMRGELHHDGEPIEESLVE